MIFKKQQFTKVYKAHSLKICKIQMKTPALESLNKFITPVTVGL